MAKKERYALWEIKDFSSGQVEKLNDNILPDTAGHEMRNFYSSRIGGLSLRKGQERLNVQPLDAAVQGLHPYYARIGNIRKVIAFAAGFGYLWSGDTFEAFEIEGMESLVGDPYFPYIGAILLDEPLFNHPDGVFPLNPTAIVLFEDTVNYIVAMNGVDAPWKWNGALVTNLENAPAKGKFPILHKEKLFCVDDEEPSTLRWSESFLPEDWPEINYWDVAKGDGDEITNMTRFVNDLMVFKTRSIHVLKGTSMEDFNMHEVHHSVGCVGPRASTVHDLKLYFVSEHGLYITNGLSVINISDLVIPDLWEGINKKEIHKACVTVWGETIRIDVPYGPESTRNNMCIYYDPKKQAFWPMSNIRTSCNIFYNDGTVDGLRLLTGDSREGYVNIQEVGSSDFGEDIEAYWKGKYFDMGKHEVEKKCREVILHDSPEYEDTVALRVSVNHGEYHYPELARIDGQLRKYEMPYEINRFRSISPMIYYKGQLPVEIRGITIPYKSKQKVGIRNDD